MLSGGMYIARGVLGFARLMGSCTSNGVLHTPAGEDVSILGVAHKSQ